MMMPPYSLHRYPIRSSSGPVLLQEGLTRTGKMAHDLRKDWQKLGGVSPS